MKNRNKNIILMTLLSAMGVGMLTVSMHHLKPKADQDSWVHEDSSTLAETINSLSDNTMERNTSSTLLEPSTSNAKEGKVLGKPVYEFEETSAIEIDELMQKYYLAKAAGDLSMLTKLLSDPSYAPSQEALEREKKYVEDFGNIICYVKKSFEEASYIVFVYHEVKFFNINTPAPYLDKFYIMTDSQGELKIYSPEYGDDLATYYAARNKDADVVALINETNQKIEEATTKDEDLKVFLEQLSSWLSKQDTEPGKE